MRIPSIEEMAAMSSEEFACYARCSKIDAAEFTPSDAVSARVHRVEEPRRRPAGSRIRLVLETSDSGCAISDSSSSADHFSFVALAETPHVLIYRTSDETSKVLYGNEKLQYDDVTGRREVAQSEIEDIRRDSNASRHYSPFTEEAFFDEAIPGSAMFSLLIEAGGGDFLQEVYLFMAHDTQDALRQSMKLMDSIAATAASGHPLGYLYYTGFGSPAHSQVLFECFVPKRRP